MTKTYLLTYDYYQSPVNGFAQAAPCDRRDRPSAERKMAHLLPLPIAFAFEYDFALVQLPSTDLPKHHLVWFLGIALALVAR